MGQVLICREEKSIRGFKQIFERECTEKLTPYLSPFIAGAIGGVASGLLAGSATAAFGRPEFGMPLGGIGAIPTGGAFGACIAGRRGFVAGAIGGIIFGTISGKIAALCNQININVKMKAKTTNFIS